MGANLGNAVVQKPEWDHHVGAEKGEIWLAFHAARFQEQTMCRVMPLRRLRANGLGV
jgi:hypothetical protein